MKHPYYLSDQQVERIQFLIEDLLCQSTIDYEILKELNSNHDKLNHDDILCSIYPICDY